MTNQEVHKRKLQAFKKAINAQNSEDIIKRYNSVATRVNRNIKRTDKFLVCDNLSEFHTHLKVSELEALIYMCETLLRFAVALVKQHEKVVQFHQIAMELNISRADLLNKAIEDLGVETLFSQMMSGEVWILTIVNYDSNKNDVSVNSWNLKGVPNIARKDTRFLEYMLKSKVVTLP